jgi:hypothetical protein
MKWLCEIQKFKNAVDLNRTGMLPPTGNLKANLKAGPSLFTHAKSAQSVNYDLKTRVLISKHACLEVRFGFKKKIGILQYLKVAFQFYSVQWYKLIHCRHLHVTMNRCR